MEETASTTMRAEAFRRLFSDRQSLRSWFDDSLPRVHSFVYARCGGMDEVAHDIAQETFLEVVRKRDDFDGRSDPLTWVLAIARHKIADHYRRLYREKRRQLELIEEHDPGLESDVSISVDAREAVLAVLQKLPEAQRVVLGLHYLDGLSVKEISKQFERSEHAVESLLARGRAAFKRIYLDRGERE